MNSLGGYQIMFTEKCQSCGCDDAITQIKKGGLGYDSNR